MMNIVNCIKMQVKKKITTRGSYKEFRKEMAVLREKIGFSSSRQRKQHEQNTDV